MANFTLASKTYNLINQMIEADGGSAYRGWLGRVIPHIGDAFRTGEDSFRSHMGASLIGGECGRAIWYGWRWVTKPKFSGRILRLFNRGHLEEARFLAMFLMIGCKVFQQDEHGNQFRITHAGGHFGGSGDGVVIGLPDLPEGTAALLECKTHGEKSFLELQKKGMRDAKFEHYVQMQVYMRKMGLAVGLYAAVNKNTDEIYLELVTLDSVTADQFLDRGAKLIELKLAPSKINESPGFFKCRWCDHRPTCHLGVAPEMNCRTCDNSLPMPDGTWRCTLHDVELTKDAQLLGCSSYQTHKGI